MKRTTHLILHGSYGSPEENWAPWLKKELKYRDETVLAPQFQVDDWSNATAAGKENFVPTHQTLENWLKTFNEILPLLDTDNLTVIAHSLAPLFVLHVLHKNPTLQIKNVLFVAPFLGKIGDIWQIEAVNKSFYVPNDFDFKDFASRIQRSHVFYSDNDPYVPTAESLGFAQKLNSKTHLVKDAGHFNTDSGYSTFSSILNFII